MLPSENLHVKNAALFCMLAVCIITDAVTAKLEPSLKAVFFFVPPSPSNPTIPRHLIKMNGLSCKVRLTSGPSNPGFPWPP